MTEITISNAQHRILEDAADLPESPIENFTQALPARAKGLMLQALERKGCIEKRGDAHYITATGCNAVGRDRAPCNTLLRSTKQSIIMSLLSREEGATLQQIIAATEWKPHSVRGHLSNLRKKRGMPIEAFTNTDGTRGYRLPSPDKNAV